MYLKIKTLILYGYICEILNKKRNLIHSNEKLRSYHILNILYGFYYSWIQN